MRVISAEEQKKVIEMADMIEAVSTALCEYSRSRTVTSGAYGYSNFPL